jgi:DNA-binding PadR family transcriptional regulator
MGCVKRLSRSLLSTCSVISVFDIMSIMEVLTPEAAVILALAPGPSSGVKIMEDLEGPELGGRPLGPGTLYPLLRRLEDAGLVRGWIEEGRSRVGRPRRFCELTISGVAALNRIRASLRAIGGGEEPVPRRTSSARRMRENLRRGFKVSSFAMRLSDAEKT